MLDVRNGKVGCQYRTSLFSGKICLPKKIMNARFSLAPPPFLPLSTKKRALKNDRYVRTQRSLLRYILELVSWWTFHVRVAHCFRISKPQTAIIFFLWCHVLVCLISGINRYVRDYTACGWGNGEKRGMSSYLKNRAHGRRFFKANRAATSIRSIYIYMWKVST